jgi:ABC-type nickel/cobalt efflux system permease component RcnA
MNAQAPLYPTPASSTADSADSSTRPQTDEHGHDHGHTHSHSHDHTHATAKRSTVLRKFPRRSLLGAGLIARLGLAAAALGVLWVTVLWALN